MVSSYFLDEQKVEVIHVPFCHSFTTTLHFVTLGIPIYYCGLLVSSCSKNLVLWVVYVILKYKCYWLRYSSPSKTVFSTIESPMMLTTIQYNAVVSLFFFFFFFFNQNVIFLFKCLLQLTLQTSFWYFPVTYCSDYPGL